MKEDSSKNNDITYIKDLNTSLIQIKTLINHAEIGLVILNENHKIIEVNKTFCDLLGYTEKEALKLTGWDYIYKFKEDEKTRNFILNDTFSFFDNNYHVKKNGDKIPVKAACSIGIQNGKKIAICFYTNITEKMESHRKLETSETMLRNFIENSNDVIFLLNEEFQPSHLSPNTKRIFGYTKKLNLDQIIEKYLPLNDKEFKKHINRFLKNKSGLTKKEFEYSVNDNKNNTKYFSIRTSIIGEKKKSIICYVRDVTKDKNYIDELKYYSYTDQLTTLYNRKFMEEQLVKLPSGNSYPISIMSADLDGLKEVNDSLGHQAGDELLRLFANILKTTSVPAESIFRIGGDEFLIIAANTREDEITTVIKDIDEKIRIHNYSPGSLLKISVSIGSATSYESSISLPTLLAKADKEMYSIKNAKKIR